MFNLGPIWKHLPPIEASAVAGSRRMRGLPTGDTIREPTPPPTIGFYALDEIDGLNDETETDNRIIALPAAPGNAAIDPNETVTSAEEIVATQWLVNGHRNLAKEPSTAPNADALRRARALIDQSASFRDSGKREEALAAIEEAVSLFRALAKDFPDALSADLAWSLRILSSCLADVRRREDALAAIEEAVEAQRGLAKNRPSDSDTELALSLNHLSNRLSGLDRHEEALLAIQESVDLYRIAAEDQPEASRPGLAASLYNLSSRLSKYDLREEAVVAIQEACSIFRILAAEQPALYDNNLAASLKKLSACTEGLSRQVEAPSEGQAGASSLGSQGLPFTSHTPRLGIVSEGIPEPIGLRRGQVAVSGPVFQPRWDSEVINIGGNYVTEDEETLVKISRLLPYAEGAFWDPSLTCLPGTRLTMLMTLFEWARGAGSEKICWLKGPAGCGKSAVLHTIAEKLKGEGLLVSAFFFSRDSASRNSPKCLFTTLARDLASLHPRAAKDISEALEAEPFLATASLSHQFNALILGPSRHLPADRPVVYIIDALDESISHELDTELLAILRDMTTHLPPQVRILITSRPTRIIEEYLSGSRHIAMHSIDVHSFENKGDIDMYVDAQLRDEAMLHKMGLASPDEVIIRDLKRLAEGLFVWIATVCNFLRTAFRPKDKIHAMLSKSYRQGSPPEKKMDQLYAAVLAECGDWEDSEFVTDYDLVMGTLVALKRPLSLDALRGLHNGSMGLEAEQLLQRFGSVLTGYRDPHQPIRILHLSFHEFVTDRAVHDDNTKYFYLSEKGHSGRLAELCVKTLNRELARPIAGTGYLTEEQDGRRGIPTVSGVSEQLVYCCAHWPRHLQDMEISQTIQAHLIAFISRHLITWIEVLAATDVFHGSLQIMQWIHVSIFSGPELHRMLMQLHLQRYAPQLEHHFQYESLANAVLVLGNRLGHQARMEESLLATQEAVILFRALQREQPEMHTAVLASSLTNLSACHSALGRAQEALLAVEDAVDLHRTLATKQPTAYNPALASSLNILSARLSALGRAQEALSAVEEAVDLHRALAEERPPAYDGDLSSSLNNLSHRLAELGRAQEALSAVEEAVNLQRALAAERPVAWSAELASSLTNLSNRLSDLSRAEEAWLAAEESVNLYSAFAPECPVEYGANPALSLKNTSNSLSPLGRAREALKAAKEAVYIHRTPAVEPQAACNTGLADAFIILSQRLAEVVRTQEALKAGREAVDLMRQLAAERPLVHSTGLANALRNLSNLLSDCGHVNEALAIFDEAMDLDNITKTELPVSHTADSGMALDHLSPHEVLGGAEEAIDPKRPRALAAEQPTVYNVDVARVLGNLSGTIEEQGAPTVPQLYSNDANGLSALKDIAEALALFKTDVSPWIFPVQWSDANNYSILSLLQDATQATGKDICKTQTGSHMIYPIEAASINTKETFQAILALDATDLSVQMTILLMDNNRYRRLLSLRNDSAQRMLNLLQARLDYPIGPDPKSRHLTALIELSERSRKYPECLSLEDITIPTIAVAGGSFGDVYKTQLAGEDIAVKVIKVYKKSNLDKLLKALDVAQGLEYLHEKDLVHADIKCANILVSHARRACLADFGLAIPRESTPFLLTATSTRGNCGTLNYTAPELFPDLINTESTVHESRKPDSACDVFAFAMVCYEMFSGCIPYQGKRDHQVIHEISSNKRPQRPADLRAQTRGLTDLVWGIVVKCWDHQPETRFSATQIVQQLRALPDRPVDDRLVDNYNMPPPSRMKYKQAQHPFSVLETITDANTALTSGVES
ncbi:hypothetical protein HWV62_15625 [Athelia sp. TMB]|nr:hypothetical protein HWV62_15625 [Athelia sp. TMB]